MAADNKKHKNRLLHEFDPILWGLLRKEAKGKKRTAPRQLEEILAERYRPHTLTEEERAEALKLAATKEQRKDQRIEPTPQKTAKKRANGPPK